MNQKTVEVVLSTIDNDNSSAIRELDLQRDEVGDALSYIKQNKLAEDVLLRKSEDKYTMMDVSGAYLTPKGKEKLSSNE
ncbi:hypothetical protein ERX37_09405 [Macrococcus hajekii]|uniref:Uncharacterized protein n=1 Tax=Macrococcus hajekii TaxID=198482 RepID=A0A4R6BIK5_9STAP|nr:hypothetical protein [Macrococcus hajekii]TDM01321.1 hypothetical protein ERX37_09405 [Macrococcus hajekii]GGB10674.1 hypothetical protein GCM10007190_18370 [Macrococcus hajekii]